MERKDLLPELRFVNFSDSWHMSNIDSILHEYRLGGNYKNSNKKTPFPLIKMGNINRGNISLEKLEYISEGETIDNNHKINYGDLFFNTRNTLELVGKVAIWRNELPIAYYNSNLLYIKFDNNFFINYLLNSFRCLKELRRVATGTTSVAAIYTRDFLKIKIYTPSLPEQQKIASFLSSVDRKIELLKKKKARLEEYKKGVMQKLFPSTSSGPSPKDSNPNPEWRFKDENGNDYPDWEVKKLGEIGEFKTSSVNKKINDDEELVFLVNYMNVYNHESITSKNIENLMKVSASQSQIKTNNLKKGDILFTPSSETPEDIGHSVVIFEDLKNTLYSYHLMRFRPIIEMDILYSHYFCNTPDILRQISRFATGSTRFTISVDSFSKIKVHLPDTREQQKIANFLTSIDSKIEKINTQIEATKQFKKGLLQKMFV
ncbi:restriction endonuclease subunit S [Membranihabitans maritimus]|uniref:restriction endonuclease subunit S n=1 Tax=Membranihabitans maritimus TaxID=2904244 RepID=UPI001F023F6C|nr:restriction endonuclease subunit S [Membranihabitans maritimus]